MKTQEGIVFWQEGNDSDAQEEAEQGDVLQNETKTVSQEAPDIAIGSTEPTEEFVARQKDEAECDAIRNELKAGSADNDSELTITDDDIAMDIAYEDAAADLEKRGAELDAEAAIDDDRPELPDGIDDFEEVGSLTPVDEMEDRHNAETLEADPERVDALVGKKKRSGDGVQFSGFKKAIGRFFSFFLGA